MDEEDRGALCEGRWALSTFHLGHFARYRATTMERQRLLVYQFLVLAALLPCWSCPGEATVPGACHSPHGSSALPWLPKPSQALQAPRRRLSMVGTQGGRRRARQRNVVKMGWRKVPRGRGRRSGAWRERDDRRRGEELVLEVVASSRASSARGVLTSLPQNVDLRNLKTLWLLPGGPEEHRSSAARDPIVGAAKLATAKQRLLKECRISPCPKFKACTGSLGGIDMCWNSHLAPQEAANISLYCPGPLQKRQYFTILPSHCQSGRKEGLAPKDEEALLSAWAGQVAVLRNVFVSPRGDVFNASHLFLPGGCAPRHDSEVRNCARRPIRSGSGYSG